MARFSLIAKFSVMSLVLLAGISVLLGIGLTRQFEQQAIEQQKLAVSALVPPVVGPYLTEDILANGAHGESYESIDKALSQLGGLGLVRVRVWNKQGMIIYSDDASVIGKQVAPGHELAEVLDGASDAQLTSPDKADNIENAGYDELLRVYTPLQIPGQSNVGAAFEGYYDADDLKERVSYINGFLWTGITFGFLFLYTTLFTLVYNASRKLAHQNQENARLYKEARLAYDMALEGWSRALDLRDKETEGHTQRVTEMTVKLARFMGIRGDDLVHIRRGALLHDIGKMGIPDAILLKPGPLTDEEWLIMKQHPVYAFDLLAPIQFLAEALDIAYYHHEKWDGSGYPTGLKGEEIPLSARIFAVVDVWDALSSDRPYRKALPTDEVFAYIAQQSGSHFDPQVVDAFFKMQFPVLSRLQSRSRVAPAVTCATKPILGLMSALSHTKESVRN